LHGDIYINAVVTSVAEIIGKLSAGVLIAKIGLRPVLLGAFFTAAVGTVFLILFPNASEVYISAFLLVTRFGASMAIVGASLGTVLITPT
jgi:MFS family permease